MRRLAAPSIPHATRAIREPRAVRVPLAVAVVLALLLANAAPAAARVPPAGTTLALQEPTAAVLGSNVDVTAVLASGGAPLGDLRVVLLVDGTQVTSGRTNAAGKVTFAVKTKDLPKAGSYTLTAAFSGTSAFVASAAQGVLKVLPAGVQIKTVPPVPGITITLGTTSAVTGPDGIAAFPVPAPGSLPVTVDFNIQGPAAQTVRASFVRWLDEVYTPNRTVDIRGPAVLEMGLRVAYRASVAYVGLDNQPVDGRIVEEARFSDGTGTDDVVINGQAGASAVWWSAATAVRRGQELAISPVTYRLLSVKIGGADVVNRGQQAWTPTEDGLWTVQLLLYGMTVQTSDALFGTPVAGKLDLVYPNGETRTEDVGSNGQVTFNNLPRGQYQLKLHTLALTPPTSVALSRAQTAQLRVVSYLDLAVAIALALAVIVLLILAGRRHQAARAVRWANARLAPRSLMARSRSRRGEDAAIDSADSSST